MPYNAAESRWDFPKSDTNLTTDNTKKSGPYALYAKDVMNNLTLADLTAAQQAKEAKAASHRLTPQQQQQLHTRQQAYKAVKKNLGDILDAAIAETKVEFAKAAAVASKVAVDVLTEKTDPQQAIKMGNHFQQQPSRRLTKLGKLLVAFGVAALAASAALLAMKIMTVGVVSFAAGVASTLLAYSFFRTKQEVNVAPKAENNTPTPQ